MDAREVIARVALSHRDLATTTAQCEAIVEGHAGGIDEGLRIAASILSQAAPQAGDAAMSVIPQLAAKYPDTAGAPHAVALVALRFNQLELAASASQQAPTGRPQVGTPDTHAPLVWRLPLYKKKPTDKI